MYISFADIQQELKQPLEYKIEKAIDAIKGGLTVSKHRYALAFSGGKDSTVLWDIIRRNFPNESKDLIVIYGNTGVEFPESLHFARELGKEWAGDNFHETKPAEIEKDELKYEAQREVLEWLKAENRLDEVLKADGKLKNTDILGKKATPEMWEDFRRRNLVWRKGQLKTFWYCVDQYGWPIMGKAASKLDAHRINIDCFLNYSQSESEKEKLHEYYGVLKKCKFSQHCCKQLKKEPSERLQAELDVDVIFKGLMASESHTRMTSFSTRGYLFKSHRPHIKDGNFYHCNPLSIWTDNDIWEYIKRYNVPYAPLYDMGYVDSQGVEHKVQRNGCFACCTDILYKDNHMKMLRKTHPQMWQSIMNKGLAEQLRNLYNVRGKGLATILDVIDDNTELLERRPCAFDDMDSLVAAEDLKEEYEEET